MTGATGTVDVDTVYDRLVYEIASLECVLKVIEAESDSCDKDSGMASAALVQRRVIRALHDVTSEIGSMALLIGKLREAARGAT